MLYSRAQLKLVLALAVTLLAGMGVREWRAGFPGVAERMERFDRAEPLAPVVFPRSEDDAPSSLRPRTPLPRPPLVAPAGSREVDGALPALAAASDPRPLDINRASLAELARLPGVGPALAARILAERERRGRFETPEALRYVVGMGPKKLGAIRELVTVGD